MKLMKGSINAKPKLLSACNHPGQSPHLGYCSEAPRRTPHCPQCRRSSRTLTLLLATSGGHHQPASLLLGLRTLSSLPCIAPISDCRFPAIHTRRRELTMATLDPLKSGWNNKLPSKIQTHIWWAVSDQASATERAACHQWAARCLLFAMKTQPTRRKFHHTYICAYFPL